MNQMSNLREGGNREEIHVSKWPWSGCFNFSCEGSAFLDDENVPCLEHCPETEMGDHRACENRRISDITFSGSVRSDEVGSSGILSCVRPTSVVTPRDFSADLERNKLFPAIRKQSNKGYSSFEPSPPLGEIMDRSQPAILSSNFTDSSEELKPLISKPQSVCGENNESEKVMNELDYVLKKEISYNKVLPFPVITKNISSHEYSGAVNSLVEFDNHTNSHSVSLGCGQDKNFNGSNSSSSSTPTLRDTMILCNDLDSACQVVPLSFSPNLYPDVGSVPLINCQLSVNKTVPPGTLGSLVNTSCSSNSLVTLLNQTKNTFSLPASWPRRRPQSLRVAICYSDPEYLQDVENAPVGSISQQKIGLNDMSAKYHRIYPSSRTTNILATVTGSGNKSVQEKQDSFQAEALTNISKDNEEHHRGESVECMRSTEENQKFVKNRKPERIRVAKILAGQGISHDENSEQSNEFSLLPEFSLDTTQIKKDSPSPVMDAVPCHLGFDDRFLRSPGSDKENDPAMLSVRPKVQCSNTAESPKKKKTSPKKKHRSPKKHKSASIKEDHLRQQKSPPLMEYDEESPRNETSKFWSLNDDAWAVDDFLPVSSRSKGQSVPQMLQDFRLSPAEAPKVSGVSSVIGASLSTKAQTSKLVTTSSSSDEMDSSMITSTFSTDTGYETETTMNSTGTDEYSTNDEKKLPRKIMSPHSSSQKDMLSEICNPSYSLPSSLATPDPLSEPSTPQTVADDTTEYYSICSELTNLIHASDDAQLHPGDDTPDFLSISSEMPGIPRLLEDSPLADLETQLLFPKDIHVGSKEDCIKSPEALNNSASCSLDSPASGDPSTLVETPAGQDSLSIPEAASGGQSPSDESSLSSTNTPSQELVEIKYVQLSLSIVLAIVLHAMQSISQFMLEIFLASDQEDHWD